MTSAPAKAVGGLCGRAEVFRPASVMHMPPMSFGPLSGVAVTAFTKGAAPAGAMQKTGEGGLSLNHLNGGDLVFQRGTSYIGCCDGGVAFTWASSRPWAGEGMSR
ncbi:glutamate synthase-related protein [Streptomyces californicus]|uniref:glutamate synthase-related protein n=1 Tax=Streptomyces californicus TaxID=67351 RepID=UPI00368FCA5A